MTKSGRRVLGRLMGKQDGDLERRWVIIFPGKTMGKSRDKSNDIAVRRLSSQKLTGSGFDSPLEVISEMGAMQAQEYPMAKWAIGLRLRGATDRDVEAALSAGEILRTHLLRPTWHFVSAEDICWLLDLTAPQIRAGQRSRDRDLELTEQVYSKSNRIIEKALAEGKHLPREPLIARLNEAGIATDQNRASHLFMRAELEKIICSGVSQGKKTTYALLSERVHHSRQPNREEALAELARRYFNSRSPARVQDFIWWSGLPARDAYQALESVKSGFFFETINGSTYWLSSKDSKSAAKPNSALLLPTYDEFIISYADRRASIHPALEQHMKEISNRGIFWPTILVNGQVVGVWKRTINEDTLLIDAEPFAESEPISPQKLSTAAQRFALFWDKKLELHIHSDPENL